MCQKLYTSTNYGTGTAVSIYDVESWSGLDKSHALYQSLIENCREENKDAENSTKMFWVSEFLSWFDIDSISVWIGQYWTAEGGANKEYYWCDQEYKPEDEGVCLSRGVRPLVILDANAQIDASDISKDGTTPEKAYILE